MSTTHPPLLTVTKTVCPQGCGRCFQPPGGGPYQCCSSLCAAGCSGTTSSQCYVSMAPPPPPPPPPSYMGGDSIELCIFINLPKMCYYRCMWLLLSPPLSLLPHPVQGRRKHRIRGRGQGVVISPWYPDPQSPSSRTQTHKAPPPCTQLASVMSREGDGMAIEGGWYGHRGGMVWP